MNKLTWSFAQTWRYEFLAILHQAYSTSLGYPTYQTLSTVFQLQRIHIFRQFWGKLLTQVCLCYLEITSSQFYVVPFFDHWGFGLVDSSVVVHANVRHFFKFTDRRKLISAFREKMTFIDHIFFSFGAMFLHLQFEQAFELKIRKVSIHCLLFGNHHHVVVSDHIGNFFAIYFWGFIHDEIVFVDGCSEIEEGLPLLETLESSQSNHGFSIVSAKHRWILFSN